jgi:hypothetical protein
MAKIGIETRVRVNIYTVIQRAVEEGVAYGYMRSYKYTDKPSKDTMITEIENAVMNELSEVLIYGDGE